MPVNNTENTNVNDNVQQQQTQQQPQQQPQSQQQEQQDDANIKKNRKKEITKHKVQSSNIDWIGYDEDSEELYVGFLNGSIYVYYDVPENIFNGFMNAGSKGRYLWAKVRDKFGYKKN